MIEADDGDMCKRTQIVGGMAVHRALAQACTWTDMRRFLRPARTSMCVPLQAVRMGLATPVYTFMHV
eukprot:13623402-Alexandrium_andersonii.AAC.1